VELRLPWSLVRSLHRMNVDVSIGTLRESNEMHNTMSLTLKRAVEITHTAQRVILTLNTRRNVSLLLRIGTNKNVKSVH
jgi:hypothetical protein